ncbi:MAG: pyridoxal-phosphate dependent enzyme [Bacteroidetes bacterium]|nr:pyridoxal-phosphate dependent enzyme [Bacteroidota bacterium]
MVNWSQGIASKNMKVSHPLLLAKGVELFVKREDLIHPEISGNKWRKLKYHMLEALKDLTCKGLLTKGGPYSNHILATASAAASSGLNSRAFIRGECILPLNPTLNRAKELGMELNFLDRTIFRKPIEELAGMEAMDGSWRLIPEGGTDALGIKGCMEILTDSDRQDFERVAVALGTGGTAAGLLSTLAKGQSLMVFSALKGLDVSNTLGVLLGNDRFHPLREHLIPMEDYHFGGYAKMDATLLSFIRDFEQETGIPLDPVYTAKMFYGLFDQIDKGLIPRGSIVLAIHTGGLQGRKGMEERLGIDFSAKA